MERFWHWLHDHSWLVGPALTLYLWGAFVVLDGSVAVVVAMTVVISAFEAGRQLERRRIKDDEAIHSEE